MNVIYINGVTVFQYYDKIEDNLEQRKLSNPHPWSVWHIHNLTLLVLKPGEFSQYHGCWCPGDARSQDISSHSIDSVGQPGLCLPVCVMSVLGNDKKRKYILKFSQKKFSTSRVKILVVQWFMSALCTNLVLSVHVNKSWWLVVPWGTMQHWQA